MKTVVNRVWNGTTTLAVARGSARAKFLGTSSPITMEKMVARKMPTTEPTAGTMASGTPADVSGALSIRLMAGSNV